MNPTPLIGITLGDAAGIAPEIIVKALPLVDKARARLVVIGDAEVLVRAAAQFGVAVPILKIPSLGDLPPEDLPGIRVLDLFKLDPNGFEMGKPNASAGELAYQAILEGTRLALAGELAALVTAPICKESLHLAGHFFDGHTGLLAHLTGRPDTKMTFSTRNLRIIHVTAHLALAEACKRITQEEVFKTIEIGHQHLQALGIEKPRIAVCGLNPHAGEAGYFGREEIDAITPAIRAAQQKGYDVKGPEPGDTVFLHAFKGKFDLVVAQYHDQGHIPGKLMAFDHGVNVTLGLPFVRCSPDHGTAFDIVGQGVANPGNLVEAISYALLLLR